MSYKKSKLIICNLGATYHRLYLYIDKSLRRRMDIILFIQIKPYYIFDMYHLPLRFPYVFDNVDRLRGYIAGVHKIFKNHHELFNHFTNTHLNLHPLINMIVDVICFSRIHAR